MKDRTIKLNGDHARAGSRWLNRKERKSGYKSQPYDVLYPTTVQVEECEGGAVLLSFHTKQRRETFRLRLDVHDIFNIAGAVEG